MTFHNRAVLFPPLPHSARRWTARSFSLQFSYSNHRWRVSATAIPTFQRRLGSGGVPVAPPCIEQYAAPPSELAIRSLCANYPLLTESDKFHICTTHGWLKPGNPAEANADLEDHTAPMRALLHIVSVPISLEIELIPLLSARVCGFSI